MPPEDSNISFETINAPEFNEEGKNTVKAISGAWQAIQIARRMQHDDWKRDEKRAKVLSAFNGEAPYSERELIQAGQGYRFNLSVGYMEGLIGRAIVPFNDVSQDYDNLATIMADLSQEKRDNIREEFLKMIKEWERWPDLSDRLNTEIVLNGWADLIWPSDDNPFPMFVEQKFGWTNDGASNCVDDLQVYTWKYEYLIHDLFAKIQDEKAAEEAGWNVANVKEAIGNAKPEDPTRENTQSESGAWSALEKQIRAGSLYYSIIGNRVIKTYHVFAKEMDNTISHWIVMDGDTISGNNSNALNRGLLFKQESRWTSWKDFLVHFSLETGDGKWHGSRGLGRRAFSTHRAKDKFVNQILDQGMVAGMTLLQPGDQTDQDELTLTPIGPFAIIPAGVQVMDKQLQAIPATTFNADALITATGQERTGDVMPDTIAPVTGEKPTATQAKIMESHRLTVKKGSLARYVTPLSQTLSIILKRLLKADTTDSRAKLFQQRLIHRGITREEMNKVKGASNAANVNEIFGAYTQEMAILFSEFRDDPNINQIELRRKRISSLAGAEVADELIIPEADQTLVVEGTRQQTGENSDAMLGQQIQVSPRDNHEVHLAEVIRFLQSLLQPDSAAVGPGVIGAVLNHGKEHLAFLEQMKNSKISPQRFKKALEQIEKAFMEQAQQQYAQQQAKAQETAPISTLPN